MSDLSGVCPLEGAWSEEGDDGRDDSGEIGRHKSPYPREKTIMFKLLGDVQIFKKDIRNNQSLRREWDRRERRKTREIDDDYTGMIDTRSIELFKPNRNERMQTRQMMTVIDWWKNLIRSETLMF